ncbi:MAG: mandelate racemase/muconate lactonizing enzyme family protein, partial [Planctomycetota bacterium]
MRTNRRKFISTALTGGLAATWLPSCRGPEAQRPDYNRLDEILKQPVLKKELFAAPVIIKSLELLRYKRSFLCRVRSTDGAEGISVGHSGMNSLYPIFVNALQP